MALKQEITMTNCCLCFVDELIVRECFINYFNFGSLHYFDIDVMSPYFIYPCAIKLPIFLLNFFFLLMIFKEIFVFSIFVLILLNHLILLNFNEVIGFLDILIYFLKCYLTVKNQILLFHQIYYLKIRV